MRVLATIASIFMTSVLLATAELHPRPEEYEVYSVVFERMCVRPQNKQVVIADRTAIAPLPRLPLWNDLAGESERRRKQDPKALSSFRSFLFTKISATAWSDFKVQNSHAAKLDADDLRLSVKATVPTHAELSGLSGPDYWPNFYRKFPDSSGLVSVSRVGFDRKSSQAVIYVVIACGELCGTGYLVLLTKSSGEWRIDDKALLFIS